MLRRLGASEEDMLVIQTNLACTYYRLGRLAEALPMYRDAYSGRLKLHGKEHGETLLVASNYAATLAELQRFEETMSLLRKMMPVAPRVLGESDTVTLKLRLLYGRVLCEDTTATLDDLREAVATLEDAGRTARRVLGGAHPLTTGIEIFLQNARTALRARETPPPSSPVTSV